MTMTQSLIVEMADYSDPLDAAAVVDLLDAYACDAMGGGEPLSAEVRARLVPGLLDTPGAFSIIARLDGTPVGLANCFESFSTFAARPLVNIHDLVVLPGHRGHGIGRAIIEAIEAEALKRGACKMTLEVLSGNSRAQALYASCGFGNYQLDPEKGSAQFWQKSLA